MMALIKYGKHLFYFHLSLVLVGLTTSTQYAIANPAYYFDEINPNQMQLYLELVINGYPTSHVVTVDYESPDFYILPQDLDITGIDNKNWLQITPREDGKIALNQIKGVTVDYQQENQQLLVTVPPSWLPNQTISSYQPQTYYPAQNSAGALFNYDTYTSKQDHGDHYTAAWTDLRLFGDYGTLQSTGSYRYQFDNSSDRYIRYDTSWQYSDQDKMITMEAGDLVTRTLSWNDPVRLGGFQISQNFAIRPDIITYPLPELSGENSLPSTLDLLINGYKVESSSLNSGPFTLTNIPFINGAGEATIVTTDALGRQVSTTVPLYVTSSLLKQGLVDYNVSTGFIRQKYGIDNFRYKHLAMSGSYRHGLTNYLTAESHLEASKDLQQVGLGGVLRLGTFGVLNSAYSQSFYNNLSGHELSLGYQYNHRLFNIAMQYNKVDRQFRSLSTFEYANFVGNTSQQITFGLPLGDAGNLVAGYFNIKSEGQSANDLFNLTWNRSFDNLGTLFFSVSKSNKNDNWTGFLQWMIPFNKNHDTVSITTNRDAQKQYSERINYNHSQPYGGGFGWNFSYQNNPHQDNYYQGDVA